MNPGAQLKTMLKNIPQKIEKCSKNDSQIGPQRFTKTEKTQKKIEIKAKKRAGKGHHFYVKT